MKNKELELARELSDLWNENAESMGEQAAYHLSCEQLGIDPDDGYSLLALLAEKKSAVGRNSGK